MCLLLIAAGVLGRELVRNARADKLALVKWKCTTIVRSRRDLVSRTRSWGDGLVARVTGKCPSYPQSQRATAMRDKAMLGLPNRVLPSSSGLKKEVYASTGVCKLVTNAYRITDQRSLERCD